ncbi:MAG: thioredoxin family protein, partial [Pseudomonadota bacterium]
MTAQLTRRSILAAAVAVGAFFVAPTLTAPEAEARTVGFSESSYKRLVASGKPFMVGVHASWCTTCARQKRVINALRASGSPYKGLTIVEMDWDKYRGSKIAKSLKI